MIAVKNPIICAVDTTSVSDAKKLAGELVGSVGALKLGLEFFTANGAAGVHEIASQNAPVFLDLKFHDIPNTVAKAIKATAGMDVFMITVHAAGGAAMMRAAADAAQEVATKTGKPKALVVGVTVLTSLDTNDMNEIGYLNDAGSQALRLAGFARSNGLDGIVCSPHEVASIRAQCGMDFTLVCPGIRPAGSSAGDQKRIMTPKEAVQAGADYLVIGRPITEAASPKNAAQEILASL